jgi:hypothetical protein
VTNIVLTYGDPLAAKQSIWRDNFLTPVGVPAVSLQSRWSCVGIQQAPPAARPPHSDGQVFLQVGVRFRTAEASARRIGTLHVLHAETADHLAPAGSIRSKILEHLLGLRFRIPVLFESLVAHEIDEFGRHLFGN